MKISFLMILVNFFVCCCETKSENFMFSNMFKNFTFLSDDKGFKDTFFGIWVKWIVDLPVQTFAPYKGSLALEYVVNIPFSIYYDHIERRHEISSDDGTEMKDQIEGEMSDRVKDEMDDQVDDQVEDEMEILVFKEKIEFFHTVNETFESMNLPGRECLRRTICELSKLGSELDVVQEVMKSLFRVPSLPKKKYPIRRYLLEYYEYLQAEKDGETRGECAEIYRNCPISTSPMISNMLFGT